MPILSPPPHLLVAALGGTIASTANASGGVAPALSGAEIAAAAGLDGIWPDLQADFTQVSQVSSANVTLEMLFDVVELARTTAADGIVLTQGTDTLEESAFGLWLLNDSGIPYRRHRGHAQSRRCPEPMGPRMSAAPP